MGGVVFHSTDLMFTYHDGAWVGSPALNLTYTFNKASIFFNFGVTGAAAGAKTYYFDDATFVP